VLRFTYISYLVYLHSPLEQKTMKLHEHSQVAVCLNSEINGYQHKLSRIYRENIAVVLTAPTLLIHPSYSYHTVAGIYWLGDYSLNSEEELWSLVNINLDRNKNGIGVRFYGENTVEPLITDTAGEFKFCPL
jgi:hypothetical protein